MCELPRCTVHWTRISIHWILDFKQLLLLLLLLCIVCTHTHPSPDTYTHLSSIPAQAKLHNLREEINKPREAYRQKLIEAERVRQETIAERDAAMRAEQDRNAPSPKGGRKSAKGKKSSAGKKKKWRVIIFL